MNESVMSSRKMFRNVVVLVSLLLFALSYFAFRYGQQVRQEIQMLGYDLAALEQELQNTARRSANLAELDGLTISEAEATRLNIMRHLGLEQTNYDFEVANRQIQQVGDVELYTREALLKTQLPYAETLTLLDRLYNTGKLAMAEITLKTSSAYGDMVDMEVTGNIFALRKEGVEQLPTTDLDDVTTGPVSGDLAPQPEEEEGLQPPPVAGAAPSNQPATQPEPQAEPTLPAESEPQSIDTQPEAEAQP